MTWLTFSCSQLQCLNFAFWRLGWHLLCLKSLSDIWRLSLFFSSANYSMLLSMEYLVLLTNNLLIISCQLISDGGSSNSLLDASNRFYTLIPHDFGMKKPPLLDNLELIQVKLDAHVWDFPSTLGNDRNVSACVRRWTKHFLTKKFNTLLENAQSRSFFIFAFFNSLFFQKPLLQGIKEVTCEMASIGGRVLINFAFASCTDDFEKGHNFSTEL